jgi:16S rRNA processing protein RimM
MQSDLVFVAKLGKTVGLKGYLKLHIDSDFPSQFKVGSTFSTNKKTTLTIDDINKDRTSVLFKGVSSIEDAKKLVNMELYTTIEETKSSCALASKQFFWFDIVGCLIIDDEEVLGKVVDINRMVDTDYLVVETSQELTKEYSKEFLIPYIDRYISSVDIESKKIYTSGARDILESS